METALGRNVGTKVESAGQARAGALQDACLSSRLLQSGWMCGRASVPVCQSVHALLNARVLCMHVRMSMVCVCMLTV